MLNIKDTIKDLRKTLLTVKIFLRRHKLVLPAVVIPIVVFPIAVETYGTLWGPHVVVYKFNCQLQGLLDREAQRQAIAGVIRRGGIDSKVQGMLDRARQREAIADVIRKGAMAAAP
jgi:hypothetical protein